MHTHHTTIQLWIFDTSITNVDIPHYLTVGCYHFQAKCMMHITVKVWRVIISRDATDSTQTVEALMDRIKLSKLSFSASQSELNTKPQLTLFYFLLYWKGNKNTVINRQSNDQCIYCLCRKLLKSSWIWKRNKIPISRIRRLPSIYVWKSVVRDVCKLL